MDFNIKAVREMTGIVCGVSREWKKRYKWLLDWKQTNFYVETWTFHAVYEAAYWWCCLFWWVGVLLPLISGGHEIWYAEGSVERLKKKLWMTVRNFFEAFFFKIQKKVFFCQALAQVPAQK